MENACGMEDAGPLPHQVGQPLAPLANTRRRGLLTDDGRTTYSMNYVPLDRNNDETYFILRELIKHPSPAGSSPFAMIRPNLVLPIEDLSQLANHLVTALIELSFFIF